MRFCLVLALLISHGTCWLAKAQIVDIRTVGDKRISCWQSGLSSDRKDCGARSEWYAYVFVGSISAINPAGNDEEQLQITPEEVFLGEPDSPLTVQTSQGLCLPKLTVGDRWLFFLRKEKDKPIVLDYYGNDSRPIAKAQNELATLRRLRNMGNLGILKGTVIPGWSADTRTPISNEHIVATRKQDGQQFLAVTSEDGRYEFPPLPAGDYRLAASPSDSFQPDPSHVEIKAGGCWDLILTRFPHAEISGQITFSDGKPAANIDVALISNDNTSYLTTQTDTDGEYSFTGQSAGKFVIGINFPKRPDWINGGGGGLNVPLPPASLFYPGVTTRSSAEIIQLKADEKLDTVDFTLPNND